MNVTNLNTKTLKGHIVTVTPSEAFALIRSLASQLEAESSNVGRLESHTDRGQYFSIIVSFPKENSNG